MKKILLGMVILLAVAAGWAVWHGQQFNAERILAQSKLNGRVFQGKVQEVSALDGTVKAYLMEEHSVPMAAAAFGFDKAGRAYEPKEGVALMAESVLLDGAGTYSRQHLREMMKEKGIKLHVSAGVDRLAFTFSFIKEFEQEALAVLRAVLYEPLLAEEDLKLARQQLAALKKRQAENPQEHLGELVKKAFYGAHPYSKPEIPDEAVLQKVTADDIRAYLQNFMARDTLNVGIAGDMDQAETEAFLTQAFAGLKGKSAAAELPAFQADFYAEPAATALPHSAQSYVVLAGKGVKRLDDDFYPLFIADYILGGSGLASRLNQAVREKEGLTYGIYSGFSNSDAVDLWQVYFSATPENAARAMDIAAEVYAAFYAGGVTAEELQQAKNGLLNSFNLRFASLLNIAQMLEQMQAQKLGRDFLETRQGKVQEVTLEKVNDAIRRRMPKALNAKGGVRQFTADGAGKL